MNNDLYISGESYAGIYVPKLAQRVDKYITDNTGKSGIYIPKLKGIMVGNGVTNWKYDTTPAFVKMGYWHGLYDDDLYNQIKDCDYSYYQFDKDKVTPDCKTALDRFNTLTASINGYDVFGKCYTSTEQMHILYEAKLGGKFLSVGSEQIPSAQYFTTRDYTPWAHIQTDKKKLKEIPPCVYAAPVVAYLNDPKTRDALHIDKTAKVWDLCANVDYASARAGSIDVYPILKGKYRMLKYSGDADGSVPTAGTL